MKTWLRVFSIVLVIFAVSVSPAEEVPSLPESVDLSRRFEEFNLPRRSQGKRGTCSVFTVVGAIEYAAAANKWLVPVASETQEASAEAESSPPFLSVEFANWAKNQVASERTRRRGREGYVTDGGFFSSIWAGFTAHGICREASMPYRDSFDPQITPSDTALEEAKRFQSVRLELDWIKEWNPNTGLDAGQIRRIKETLSEGIPVCVGLRWPNRARWENGALAMVPPEDVHDGHSVLFIGYSERDAVFIYRNTQNPRRNEQMTFEYAANYANDVAVVRLTAATIATTAKLDFPLSPSR